MSNLSSKHLVDWTAACALLGCPICLGADGVSRVMERSLTMGQDGLCTLLQCCEECGFSPEPVCFVLPAEVQEEEFVETKPVTTSETTPPLAAKPQDSRLLPFAQIIGSLPPHIEITHPQTGHTVSLRKFSSSIAVSQAEMASSSGCSFVAYLEGQTEFCRRVYLSDSPGYDLAKEVAAFTESALEFLSSFLSNPVPLKVPVPMATGSVVRYRGVNGIEVGAGSALVR